jgi:hypothetical protein
MIPFAPPNDELARLLEASCLDELSSEQAARLEELVRGSDECRAHYVLFMHMHALAERREAHAGQPAGGWLETRCRRPSPIVVAAAEPQSPGLLGAPIRGAFGYVLQGWPVAYLVATVAVSVGLLIAALTYVSKPEQLVGSDPAVHHPLPTANCVVAQITDMVDCQFAGTKTEDPNLKSEIRNPKSETISKSPVCLGDRFNLLSGLLEITYDTGAQVILQGPVTYKVESPSGGYISVGRLTASVENSKTKDQRPKTENHNPKSPNLQISEFTVRTPTALVTDLGTEFGVEVTRSGETTSHVFRGSIRVQKVGPNGTPEADSQVLRENQTVRVEGAPESRQIVALRNFASSCFVRQIPNHAIKSLDLVDVVAGGDGFSSRRGRGLDPTTGLAGSEFGKFDAYGDHKYHRAVGMPLVDGVFIPDGSKGPVQVDSAGHVFPDCPTTDNNSWFNVWAGGALPRGVAARMSTTLGDVKYFSPEHPALLMHANKGLTFDLDAIRRANPGYKVLRFRGVTGNMEPNSEKGHNVSADIWVLVDGQVRFKRREITHFIGAMPIHIPIADHDRYLTLSATDGGNSYQCDMVVFGDPRLELVGHK